MAALTHTYRQPIGPVVPTDADACAMTGTPWSLAFGRNDETCALVARYLR